MKHKLDVSKIENPYIQVVWEDIPENFTQERVKSVELILLKNITALTLMF